MLLTVVGPLRLASTAPFVASLASTSIALSPNAQFLASVRPSPSTCLMVSLINPSTLSIFSLLPALSTVPLVSF